jgi:Fe-S cluster assembly ATP-binding protein
MLFEIKNLHVSVEKKAILKGLHLTIKPGEIHVIMGPNGSGKSTLGSVLAGKNGYVVTEGEVLLNKKKLLNLSPEVRSVLGIFLGFQYPVNIPGVSNTQFLKTSLNSIRKGRHEKEIDAISFMKLLRKNMQIIQMNQGYMKRAVNEGFSGGEKKKNEILQMMMLEPKVCILDEIDSGLDIDALQIVSKGINHMRSSERSFIIITHYQRLLNYITPDYVHVLADGKIVRSGDIKLACELEKKGYSWIVRD